MSPKLDLTSRRETEQLVSARERGVEVGRFWLSESFWESRTGEWEGVYSRGVCEMVSSAGAFVGRQKVRAEGRFVGGWDGIRGVDAKETVLRGKFGYRSVDEDLPRFRDADGGGVGRVRGAAGLDEFSEEREDGFEEDFFYLFDCLDTVLADS